MPHPSSVRQTERLLPGRFRDMLVTGNVEAYDGDRSRARMALAMAYVNRGFTFADFLQDLTDPAHEAAKWYRLDRRGKVRGNSDRLIRRDWESALRRVREHPSIAQPSEAEQAIGLLTGRATTHLWVGRTGSTDRAVLGAIHRVATASRTLVVDLSVRRLAETSGVSRGTAHRALRRLQDQGWIVFIGPADRTRGLAASYRLSEPRGGGSVDEPVSFVTPLNDYWAKAGPIGAHLYEALAPGPRSTGELVALTGRSRKTVERHLRALRDDGVTAVNQSGQWVAIDCDFEALAGQHGWTGHLRARQDAHERERAAHVLSLGLAIPMEISAGGGGDRAG